jgi:2-succinyl-6-hydroxy-2,4-cyclohexadiene-1-carboxylate synthase
MPCLTINDALINVETWGSGTPLVLLHGFMGSARTWEMHLPAFTDQHQVIVPDLLGHGLSEAPVDPSRYNMACCIADLAAILDYYHLDRVHLLGYSLGGRIGLAFAIKYPDRVGSLVLESASPGIADPIERRKRVAADEALAEWLERDRLAAFVDYWERLPLFASQTHLPAHVQAALRSQRMQNRVEGLANSLRGVGAGAQPTLWDRLTGVALPCLVIVGALDAKFIDIGQAIVQRLPKARLVVVPGAGHTVHLEQPVAFDRLVLDHLADHSVTYRPSAETG